MTKDEAWKAHVEEYDRDRFDSTSRHRRHCFDAGWEAALADTLRLLETLAKMGDDIIWRGLQVRCIPETGYFLYFRPVDNHFRPVDNLVNLILLSRAEAEALLGKGQ